MSLKDEINYVKEELTSDEKLLESAFRLERIYKKHKVKIWAVVALLVIGFGGKALWGAYRDYQLSKANDAYLTLQKHPDDKAAQETLKSANPRLWALYLYARAVKSGDAKALDAIPVGDDALLKDLITYHRAVLGSRPGDSRYYADLSRVEKAYEALKAGHKDEARQLLSAIAENSPLAPIARLLRHATL